MRQIAILFEFDAAWMGGVYYFRNLISAMKLLPKADQPFILLISERSESVDVILETGYPHIGWLKQAEFEAVVKEGLVDVVFPHPFLGEEARTVSWIPDFQELHLGYFFSDQEVAARRDHHRRRFATAGLIVSSEDVRKDVDTYYPGECKNVAVVRFASFDKPDGGNVDLVRQKYDLPERYIFCANQVWLHKNHIVIIRAVALLKDMGVDVTMVFTGSEADYRLTGYADFLKRLSKEWGVDDRVRFLGFLPRQDQLCLMKGAHYVVQPSLFEGWSTVIEDAKLMGKFIVASDLTVHKEQLSEACEFFFRHDPQDLARVMLQIEEHEKVKALPARRSDYGEVQRGFARDFIAAVERFVPSLGEAELQHAGLRIRQLSDANMATLSVALTAPPQTGAVQGGPFDLRRGGHIQFAGRGAALADYGWQEGTAGQCMSHLPEARVPLLIEYDLCPDGVPLQFEVEVLPGEVRQLRFLCGGETLFDGRLTEGHHLLELVVSAKSAGLAPLHFSAHSAQGLPCALGIVLHALRVSVPAMRPGKRVELGSKAAQAMLLAGWSRPEGSHIWSIAPDAEISFVAPLDEHEYELVLLLKGHADALLSVHINEDELTSLNATGVVQRVSVRLPRACRGRLTRLRLCSNSSRNFPGDLRNLHLCAFEITLSVLADGSLMSYSPTLGQISG